MKLLLKGFIFSWLMATSFVSWAATNVVTGLMLVSVNAADYAFITWTMSATVGLSMAVLAYKSLSFDLIEYVSTNFRVKSDVQE